MATDIRRDEEKRRPTLADRFVTRRFAEYERLIHPKAIEQLQRSTRNARRFVFNEEAARRIARVVIEAPELLVREHQFARAPFEQTWIEYPAWAYYAELREQDPKLYDAQGEWGDTETGDHTVGYLIDQGRINTISAGTKAHPDTPCLITPLQYRLHAEWPIEDQIEFARLAGCSRLGLDPIIWGSSWDKLSKDDTRRLREHNVIEGVPLNPLFANSKMLQGDGGLATSVRGAIGDLRTVVAMLLMLNRPSLTQFRVVPRSQGFRRGKLMTFMSHTTVEVSLDSAATLRLIGTPAGETIERRRHEVRGHYCHDQTARDYMRIAGCIHEWQRCHDDWTPWPDGPVGVVTNRVNHWHCTVCGGKRWWRHEHERGTAEVGFVAHDLYEVSP